MTRLPPDSFLPSGALDHDSRSPFVNGQTNGDSPSAVPPLSLPQAPRELSYFDIHPQPSHPSSNNQISSPLSASAAVARYPQNALSPHLFPVANYDRRSASLSPTRRAKTGNQTRSTMTSPSRHPANVLSSPLFGAATSHPRSVSADAASPSQSQLVSRLAQQNNRIRDTWEAERKYLEANRERVEEVYKEERVIMDQERAAWDSERTYLQDQIRQLQTAVSELQMHNVLLSKRLDLERAGKMAGISVPLAGLRGGTGDGPLDLGFSSGSSFQSPQQRMLPGDLSSSSNSGSKAMSPIQNRVHYISSNASRMSPVKQPEVSTFIPLNQHIQPPTAPASDFLAAPKNDAKIPSIDVQELHPDLEGIPINATAVKKDTFKDEPSSPSKSQTPSAEASPPGDPSKLKRGASKEHTLQILNANESDRLVMHAGHTPSHSLSHLPTLMSTEAATVIGRSGESTPTQAIEDAASNPACDAEEGEPNDKEADRFQVPQVDGQVDADHPEEKFEPTGDSKLKGPLMVRNIPAYDQEFFKLVNEKLESIQSGQGAIPSVLKNPIEGDAETANQEASAQPITLGYQPSASGHGKTIVDELQSDEDEADIPLKIKTSLNFGLPLGEMH
jgi:hypothetical protein